jgi:hypothetical protein
MIEKIRALIKTLPEDRQAEYREKLRVRLEGKVLEKKSKDRAGKLNAHIKQVSQEQVESAEIEKQLDSLEARQLSDLKKSLGELNKEIETEISKSAKESKKFTKAVAGEVRKVLQAHRGEIDDLVKLYKASSSEIGGLKKRVDRAINEKETQILENAQEFAKSLSGDEVDEVKKLIEARFKKMRLFISRGRPNWGEIQGDIEDQEDLVTYLDNGYLRLDTSNDPLTGDLSMGDNAITDVNYIDFDLEDGVPPAEGRLKWNVEDGTLEVGMPGGNVNLQIGQEQLIRATNGQGAQINNGKVVYVSGATGANPEIKLASNLVNSQARATIGVATEDIAAGQKGFITTFGIVRDFDTSMAAAGRPVFLGETPGELVGTQPTNPSNVIFVGIVIRSHPIEGELLVTIRDNRWLKVFEATEDPSGFEPNQAGFRGDLSFDNGTRTFTIEPQAGQPYFNYWFRGSELQHTAADTLQITDIEGLHFLYYDSSDTLVEVVNPSDQQVDEVIRENVSVSIIYWDATNKEYVWLNDERHLTMPGLTHSYLHFTRGTQWLFGGALGNFVIDDGGDLDEDAQFSYSFGGITDEDLDTSEVNIASTVGLEILYLDNGNWRRTTESGFSVLTDITAGVGATGRLVYNDVSTPGSEGLVTIANNDYVLCHILQTSGVDSGERVFAIVGQADYANIVQAREGAITEVNNLITTGLPGPEFVFLGSVIFQTSNGYTNGAKARTRTTDLGEEYVDWRTTELSPSSPGTNHSALAGLTNDDHVQYSLADGTRPFTGTVGGVTPVAGADLATKGYVDSSAGGNPGGRLTLTSGKPWNNDDVTSATLYYTPYKSNNISIYNSTDSIWESLKFTETSLSLAGYTANEVRDIFAYNSGGSLALESVAWGTSTAYNISAMTIADPCVITYLSSAQQFAVGDTICIQGITGDINTKFHTVGTVDAVGPLVPGVSYQVTIGMASTGLTYTSGGTIRLLKNTRATPISTLNNIPVKSGDSSRRYLGTIMIGGDGGETHSTSARRFVANYYNREPMSVFASLNVAATFVFSGSSAYVVPPVTDGQEDGRGRFSYVVPYDKTFADITWATAGFSSAGGSHILMLEQSNITHTAGSPGATSAFNASASVFGSAFAKLDDEAKDEGFNYLQKLVYGTTGQTYTFWVGDTSTGSIFQFGMRGSVLL